MKRALIRPARGFGKEGQENIARAAGATTLYYGPVQAQNAVNAIRKNREGGVLGVVGYRSLSGSKKELLRLLKELHAKGCAAQDCATGRRSDGPDANDLMAEYDKQMAHERAGGREFSEIAGAEGGKVAARNRAAKRAPKDKALRIWKDLTIPTNAMAVEKIAALGYSIRWGMGALRNQFGVSGRPMGRRSAD